MKKVVGMMLVLLLTVSMAASPVKEDGCPGIVFIDNHENGTADKWCYTGGAEGWYHMAWRACPKCPWIAD